jgi:hypothetical protein
MNLVSKILVFLILIASFGFLYLASAMLATEGAWHTKVNEFERMLEQDQATQDQLVNGGQRARMTRFPLEAGLPKTDGVEPADMPGIRQYTTLLQDLLLDRGRVWTGTRGQLTPTGDASVAIEKPKPAGIPPKSVLYVFEGRPAIQNGSYLGEFKVTAATDASVTLSPAAHMTAAELQRISQGDTKWVLFETMPVDREWVFGGMSDADLAAVLPEAIREPFLHGDKPKEWQRPLRAYLIKFREFRVLMQDLRDQIVTQTTELDRLKTTATTTAAQVQARDMEIKTLQADLERAKAETMLVDTQVKAFETRVAELRAETDRLLAENRKLAERWAEFERQAVGQGGTLSRAP